jgi:hypothetical protein
MCLVLMYQAGLIKHNTVVLQTKSAVKQNFVFDYGFLFYLILIVPHDRTVQAKACVNVVSLTVCAA